MSTHPLAGQPVPVETRAGIPELVASYYSEHPDPEEIEHLVSFGTSGHRGRATECSFNEDHILAICQAIVDYRREQGTDGPMFVARDTHALSAPAYVTALEVFAANGTDLVLDSGSAYTPTPVLSHAVLGYNRDRRSGFADGVVITPSHNPPEDGGFKYNPPTGGPADTDATADIQARANRFLADGLRGVRRVSAREARSAATTRHQDLLQTYVADLGSVLDLDAVRDAGVRIGADPLGGTSIDYWDPIADRFGLDIEVVNRDVDPRFAFMTLDWDGRIRMDCSSPFAMAGLIGLRDRFDIAVGNDPDADRHGIVTPGAGLMNPNHYLAAAVWYLFQNREAWPRAAGIGKTVVSSSMIDRVAAELGRELVEVPVGFKWFVDGLLGGSLGFGGEESAGASFLRRDGGVWSTDKDGILLCLLAAEMTARTGRDPSEIYVELEARFGSPVYERIDAPADRVQKSVLKALSPDAVRADSLAGEPITARLTRAPGNGAPLGGLKVVTENGWFAARPSGTEDVYKIYAESFLGSDHLRRIQDEAREIVGEAFRAAAT
jgi:phosphoglucomutase